jgi:hypothetical protein
MSADQNRQMIRYLSVRLDELISDGLEDSPEADHVRASIEAHQRAVKDGRYDPILI